MKENRLSDEKGLSKACPVMRQTTRTLESRQTALGELVMGPSLSLHKLKPTFFFLPFYRDSSRKHDKMRPKIIFGGKVYFFMVCLH